MRCADVAMYRAKAAHSPYDIYESALDDGADRMNLMEDLRTALDEGGLTLYYQPQIDLRTGAISTLEALLRWPHPDLGFIPPDQFIPLAEDSGLMGPLTTFVLERAVAQCAAWRRAGPELERMRREEIRKADTSRSIPAFDGLFEGAVRDFPPRPTSGLVEQQLCFRLSRK